MEHKDLQKKDFRLFEEFPPVSPGEWKEKIIQDLHGADYEKKLVWNTNEGFKIKPFYVEDDLSDLEYLNVFPDEFPFTRSSGKYTNSWKIRQDVRVDDLEAANQKVLDILMKGVDSIGFIMDTDRTYTYEDMDLLFRNIFAESIEINFICGGKAFSILEIILDLVKRYNRDLNKITGSVDYDPLGELSVKGIVPRNDCYEQCKKLIQIAEHLPHFRLITVHGKYFHNAGASIVEELAFSLAQGVEYLSQLTEKELSVNQVSPRIKFIFAAGSNYFMEIAKLRAARMLWAHIVKAFGAHSPEVCKMFIHTENSRWNKTIYDPYVNMLRTTTETMSTLIGGTDSHTVLPFNAVYEDPTVFSERIARNQQLLLREESYLDKVIDPAAGSYYIENLTDQISEKAWELFLKVEEKGGYVEAFRQGYIQDVIEQTSTKRDIDLAKRKEVLLGTNQYPNSEEIFDRSIPLVTDKSDTESEEIRVLRPYRGAMAFERLRLATEAYSKVNKRPTVFMLTVGNKGMRRARAQFASNFFACAGFRIIDNTGFKTVEQGIEAAREAEASIVVICSSDEEYIKVAPAIFRALGNNAIIVVAGYPADSLEQLKKEGISHFIHAGSNVLESLEQFMKELEIPPGLDLH